MNNIPTYKRVKINWWIIILFGGTHVLMLLSYIHQWGSRPFSMSELIVMFIIMSIIWIFIYMLLGWRKVMIDDKFVIFRSGFPLYNKIEIAQIKDISIVNVNILNVMYWNWGMMYSDTGMLIGMKFPEKYSFDLVKQTVIVKLKNGKTYQIAIKDAERVRKEIERQMITTNNKPQ